MSAVIMMLAVTVCYTITSLSDKYAVSEAKFTSDEFTFLMCSSMSVFLAFSLPFQKISFAFTWQSFLAIILVAVCKMLEFQMSAVVLKQLTAFELKAWLGITLFASYLSDVILGAELKIISIACIMVTTVGLVCIARSGREGKVDYKSIIIPLALYLLSKFGYGIVIKAFSPYASSIMQLLPAMITVALIMLFKVSIPAISDITERLFGYNRRSVFFMHPLKLRFPYIEPFFDFFHTIKDCTKSQILRRKLLGEAFLCVSLKTEPIYAKSNRVKDG